ncbi:MAG: lipoyl(octanoyl) transferase LipB [Proteobacteria bacterium]|nr:lipoyl(octanoyl) transferase LipB [Pseudomonadota bacterium]
MTQEGHCLELGIEEYGKIFQLQKQIHHARRNGFLPDTVILLEHHPCLTVGRKGGYDHILVSDQFLDQEGIEVYETDRGGDITYHGPGQLVCYPILDLNRFGCDVHWYARQMEETLIRTLESFGIAAGRKEGYPGVWTGAAKIGAEGIAIRHWVTMHGVSLNVCPDMNPFSFILPCGISTLGVTSMEELLGRPVDMALVRREVRRQLSRVFDLTLEDINLEQLVDRVGNAGLAKLSDITPSAEMRRKRKFRLSADDAFVKFQGVSGLL